MSTHKRFAAAAGLAAFVAGTAFAQEGPGLGEPISAADLAPWDISIETDGSGLPAGSGTAADGEAIYQVKCIACHGEKGQGRPNDRLVGGEGTLADFNQVRTLGSYWPHATTVFDYIRRAMPFTTPETLSNDEAYALTAYLLYLNGIIDADDEMNARSLARVHMPNEDGFIVAWPKKPDLSD